MTRIVLATALVSVCAGCAGGAGGAGAATEPLYASARLDLRTREGRIAIVDLWGDGADARPEGEIVRVGMRVENRGRRRVLLAPLELAAHARGRVVVATLIDAPGSFTPYLTRRLTLSFLLPPDTRVADVDRFCLTWGFVHRKRELIVEVSRFVRQGERFLYTPSLQSCDVPLRGAVRVYDHAYYRADLE